MNPNRLTQRYTILKIANLKIEDPKHSKKKTNNWLQSKYKYKYKGISQLFCRNFVTIRK